jgi:hypothetical protein
MTASVQADVKLGSKMTVSAELRQVEETDQSATANTVNATDGKGTLAALKLGYDLNDNLNFYLIGQSTLEKAGHYQANDLITVGTQANLSEKVALVAELSSGNRGDAATLGLDYKRNDSHKLYTNYTLSKNSKNTERNLFTVGQRKSVTDRLSVFTEHQFTRETAQSGLGNNLGLDYDLSKALSLNASIQAANLAQVGGGTTDRHAASVGLNYNKGNTKASTRLEYRLDKSATAETEQWATTNRIDYRLNPSLRIQGKLNASETSNPLDNSLEAKFIEAGVGFALRPTKNDRLNVIGRLTQLYDLQPSSQGSEADEQSLIGSLEGSYQLNQRWEVGGKIAHKQGKIKQNSTSGDWAKNDASLASARLRYHLTSNWDAAAQYHWLNSDESQDTQHGAVISVDRHLGNNLKLGLGYNFTQFDDDLSNTEGSAEGLFVNIVGKF